MDVSVIAGGDEQELAAVHRYQKQRDDGVATAVGGNQETQRRDVNAAEGAATREYGPAVATVQAESRHGSGGKAQGTHTLIIYHLFTYTAAGRI